MNCENEQSYSIGSGKVGGPVMITDVEEVQSAMNRVKIHF